MLRFLLRRLPRFGFLTLFAAMLLFVSGAGWFKFHYDLYLEEERLLADLAKAECDVGFVRVGDMPRSTPPREPPWYRLPEPFRRIRELRIFYSREEDRPLIERAATLPLVDDIDARFLPANRVAPPPATLYPDAASFVTGKGVKLPQLPDAPIPDLNQPLPEGEPLSEGEIVATVGAWRAAWSKTTHFPRTGIVRSTGKDASRHAFQEAIEIRGSDGFLQAFDRGLSIGNRRKLSELRVERAGLLETQRQLHPDLIDWFVGDPESRWLEPNTGRRQIELAFLHTKGPVRFYALNQDLNRSTVESVQRTEAGWLRIDFQPTKKSFPAEGIEDEVRLSVVIRPDRDFAVEAYDIRIERTDAASPEPIVWTSRYRSVSSDHGGAYLVDAYATDSLSSNSRRPAAPTYFLRRWSGRHAYDFEDEPPAALFEPATYGAIEFPPPRPLPVWRWYRMTFVLSLALLAFILARKVAARFRRKAGPLTSSESAEDEPMPADAEAVTSR